MPERILQESEEIKPGDRLTVFFKPWWLDANTLKPEIVRVFGGTIFPVEVVTVSLFGEVAFSGTARGNGGLFTTLPGRNITAAEFRTFCNSRLALVAGATGDVAAGRIVAGDQASDNAAPGKPTLYIIIGIVGVIAVAYLLAGVGNVGRLVKGQ